MVKIVNKYTNYELQQPDATSLAISVAIIAYGIILISKLKVDILKK